jgi:hypothetical protein
MTLRMNVPRLDGLPGLVEVSIPEQCPRCNAQYEIWHAPKGYPDILEHRGLNLTWCQYGSLYKEVHGMCTYDADVAPVTQRNYHNLYCVRCGEHYPFAEPNQPDGSLKCYRCRVGL